jgi:protein-S-isoprenylcysteine O-methyltransferase Ste14
MVVAVLFRVGVASLVALAVGGVGSLGRLPLLVYLALEAALSIVEGRHARPLAKFAEPSPASIPAEQLGFVMSGKRYLFVRLIYHGVLVAVCAASAFQQPLVTMLLIGATVMGLGVGLRGWSMATLGERFRGFETRRETEGLEMSGPYAYVRHPGYLALMLTDLGAPLVLGVPLMAIAWIVPAALIVARILVEEPLVAAHYPESWPAYSARTSRLIPGVY